MTEEEERVCLVRVRLLCFIPPNSCLSSRTYQELLMLVIGFYYHLYLSDSVHETVLHVVACKDLLRKLDIM